MKTSAKYFRLAVGPRSGTSSQKWPKTYITYDVTHKKTKPKTNKIFFHCRLQDLPSLLTLWEPAYDIFIPRFRPKTSNCQLLYQCHSSFADCARELLMLNQIGHSSSPHSKKTFGWGLRIFCDWRHKWSSFGSFWLMLPDLGPNC